MMRRRGARRPAGAPFAGPGFALVCPPRRPPGRPARDPPLVTETAALTALVLFVAYLVRGIAGFGSGLIAIPLLTLLHPIGVVVPLVVLLDFLGSAAQGVKGRESISWPDLAPLLPFTLAGVLAALYLFASVEPERLEAALGAFVIAFAVYQVLPLPPLRGSRAWAAPAGALGGFVGTLFGTGGPFYMIYLQLRGLDKTATRASFATWFFVDGGLRLAGFAAVGMLSVGLLGTLALWLPAAALGLLVGGRMQLGIGPRTFRHFISLLLVFSGYRLLTG